MPTFNARRAKSIYQAVRPTCNIGIYREIPRMGPVDIGLPAGVLGLELDVFCSGLGSREANRTDAVADREKARRLDQGPEIRPRPLGVPHVVAVRAHDEGGLEGAHPAL